MNANQIINMIMRLVMRRVLSKGVDMGINGAANLAQRRKGAKGAGADGSYVDDHGNIVQPDAQQQQQVKASQRQAKQAMRAARRLGRM